MLVKSDELLDIVQKSNTLEEKDIQKLSEIRNELIKDYQTAQIFRTNTEARLSVLNDRDYPTPDAKYWQSVREQLVHFDQLVVESCEYKKSLIDIKILESKLKTTSKLKDENLSTELDLLEAQKIEVEIEKQKYLSTQKLRMCKDRVREIMMWSEIKKELEPQLDAGTDNVNNHQLVSITKRFIQEYINLKQLGMIGSFKSTEGASNVLMHLKSFVNQSIKDGFEDKIFEDINENLKKEILMICKN